MRKTAWIAWRELTTTIATKGFVIGVLVMPLLLLVVLTVGPLIMSNKPPPVNGTVAVLDETGKVYDLLAERLKPETVAAMYGEAGAAMIKKAREQTKLLGAEHSAIGETANAAAESMAAAGAPTLRLMKLDAGSDLAVAKAHLAEPAEADGWLAVVVVKAGALKMRVGEAHGEDAAEARSEPYDVFVRPKLDESLESLINSSAAVAIGDARLIARGLDPAQTRALMNVMPAAAVTVTVNGEHGSIGGGQLLVPIGLMFLLWMSTMAGGQNLLTSTIEEKSNRIMEVLLSAASPMQLMLGKILGQMGVGLLILAMYTALGTGALASLSSLYILDTANLALLLVYFFLAYFLIAAIMAAIGAAVSEVHEAQALLTPIMMVMVLPMMLSGALVRNPNGVLPTVLSFVPGLSPFVMVLRVPAAAGGVPVPAWQIAGSIAVSAVSVLVVLWLAAKVFRIGVLMYGKPPNFATLVRWVRMA